MMLKPPLVSTNRVLINSCHSIIHNPFHAFILWLYKILYALCSSQRACRSESGTAGVASPLGVAALVCRSLFFNKGLRSG